MEDAAATVITWTSYMLHIYFCVNSCRILPLDLTESDALPSKVEQATKAFGHIDILILAAGILQFGYFKDIPPELDRRVMEVNYFGQRTLIQAVLPGELCACSSHAMEPYSHTVQCS